MKIECPGQITLIEQVIDCTFDDIHLASIIYRKISNYHLLAGLFIILALLFGVINKKSVAIVK